MDGVMLRVISDQDISAQSDASGHILRIILLYLNSVLDCLAVRVILQKVVLAFCCLLCFPGIIVISCLIGLRNLCGTGKASLYRSGHGVLRSCRSRASDAVARHRHIQEIRYGSNVIVQIFEGSVIVILQDHGDRDGPAINLYTTDLEEFIVCQCCLLRSIFVNLQSCRCGQSSREGAADSACADGGHPVLVALRHLLDLVGDRLHIQSSDVGIALACLHHVDGIMLRVVSDQDISTQDDTSAHILRSVLLHLNCILNCLAVGIILQKVVLAFCCLLRMPGKLILVYSSD